MKTFNSHQEFLLWSTRLFQAAQNQRRGFLIWWKSFCKLLKDQSLNQILLSQGYIKDASWNFLQHFHIFENLTKVFFFVYFVNNSFKKPRRKEKYSLWIFFSKINKCNAFSLTRRQVFTWSYSPSGAVRVMIDKSIKTLFLVSRLWWTTYFVSKSVIFWSPPYGDEIVYERPPYNTLYWKCFVPGGARVVMAPPELPTNCTPGFSDLPWWKLFLFLYKYYRDIQFFHNSAFSII